MFVCVLWAPLANAGDFGREFQPYLEGAKYPQNAQWDNDRWNIDHWIEARDGYASRVIGGFYHADIVSDFYPERRIPLLVVGQRFLRLSGLEKRRIVKFMDDVYGVTGASRAGVIMVRLDDDELLGVYDGVRLQLQ